MSDTQNTNMCPDPEPDGETRVHDNPAFVNKCMSNISNRATSLGWRLGNSILTRSDVWGFVFRIDLRSRREVQSSEISHRFICWSAEKDDTIAGTALVPAFKLKPL